MDLKQDPWGFFINKEVKMANLSLYELIRNILQERLKLNHQKRTRALLYGLSVQRLQFQLNIKLTYEKFDTKK